MMFAMMAAPTAVARKTMCVVMSTILFLKNEMLIIINIAFKYMVMYYIKYYTAVILYLNTADVLT